jgi:serine/threonine protein phosphatase PrpC
MASSPPVADGVGGREGRPDCRRAGRSEILSMVIMRPPSTLGVAACATAAIGPYNRWLHRMGSIDPNMEGAADHPSRRSCCAGRRLHALHVGDSRAWRLRSGVLTCLTDDHVLPQPGLRHVLYRALGVESEVRLDTRIEELALAPIDCC